MVDDDTTKHRMETDHNKIVKFRKNLEVYIYLKDQMNFVEQQREINL